MLIFNQEVTCLKNRSILQPYEISAWYAHGATIGRRSLVAQIPIKELHITFHRIIICANDKNVIRISKKNRC